MKCTAFLPSPCEIRASPGAPFQYHSLQEGQSCEYCPPIHCPSAASWSAPQVLRPPGDSQSHILSGRTETPGSCGSRRHPSTAHEGQEQLQRRQQAPAVLAGGLREGMLIWEVGQQSLAGLGSQEWWERGVQGGWGWSTGAGGLELAQSLPVSSAPLLLQAHCLPTPFLLGFPHGSIIGKRATSQPPF